MIYSKIFEEDNLRHIQNSLLKLLNDCEDFGSKRFFSSPRAVGDLAQDILGEKMSLCFPAGIIKDFSDSFARRAMADMAFYDNEDNYFVIDVKTHNQSTSFNMPNLTSVERLSRFYEDDKNFFVILLAEYKIDESGLRFTSVRLIPIEHLEWSCLTVGALGWGQIQISNANVINVNRNQTRKDWMLKLCEKLEIFYPKEIDKIKKRINHFEKVSNFWQAK